MNERPIKTEGPSIYGHWDDLDSIERIKVILENRDLFVSCGLVRPLELAMVASTSESEWEYISENHPDILFQNINIQKKIRAQAHRDKLEAALGKCGLF